MKFTSVVAVATLVLRSVSCQDLKEDLVPKLDSVQELELWSKEVEQAVADIENSKNGTARISLEERLQKVVSGFFAEAKKELKCKACQIGVGATSRVSRWPFTYSPMLTAFEKFCELTSNQSSSVCKGIAHSSGDLAYKVFRKLNLDDENIRPLTCYAFGSLCPMPDINTKALVFPAKPENIKPAPKSKGATKLIVQFTDLHYDAEYKEGSEAECKKPICCQADSNSDEEDPKKVSRPANRWGDYKCDNSKLMTESILKKVAELNTHMKFDMVLFSGDVPAHDMWKETVERAKHSESESYRMIDSIIDSKKNKIYPVIGNHESVPVNSFPIDGKLDSDDFFLYKFIGQQWKDWLPSKTFKTVAESGYYSVQHTPNLKIIVLNNNLCYKYNLYLLLDPSNGDPNGMLAWLISELNDAEKSGSRVYISSHVPPGSADCFHHWSNNFNAIVQRYSHLISAQFYGHLHYDEFHLFYNSDKKTAESAISHGYLAPSMTTFGGINPGFRVYQVDSETYEVVDYFQYYADLTKADTWDNSPKFDILYSARSHYGNNISTDKLRYLTPQFWHGVTESLESDPTKFDAYYNFRTKNANTLPKCDEKCKKRLICSLRAGKSIDNCMEFDINEF